MSRVGKLPVELPKGVKVGVNAGLISVEGPKGKLDFRHGSGVEVALDNGKVVVRRLAEDRQSRANHGSTRSIIENMVIGVDKGWSRVLELNGVGYVAKLQGQKLVLSVGFSHDVELEIPKGVKAAVEKNQIKLESADRDTLGVFASRIRRVQPPEPYLGKGIKYLEEKIRRKAGKTGKK